MDDLDNKWIEFQQSKLAAKRRHSELLAAYETAKVEAVKADMKVKAMGRGSKSDELLAAYSEAKKAHIARDVAKAKVSDSNARLSEIKTEEAVIRAEFKAAKAVDKGSSAYIERSKFDALRMKISDFIERYDSGQDYQLELAQLRMNCDWRHPETVRLGTLVNDAINATHCEGVR